MSYQALKFNFTITITHNVPLFYLSMSFWPSKAKFIVAIIVEVLTVVFVFFSLLLDQGGRAHRHQQPDVITMALEWAKQNGVFTTNPNYLIGGKKLETVAVKVEEKAESSSKTTKVGKERRVEGLWIAVRKEAGEWQQSEELRRVYGCGRVV